MRLESGRRFLYQWELDQKLLPDVDCKMVHFANGTTKEALSVDVIDGKANVPNIFLQATANIKCYAWNGNSVVAYAEFSVRAREKPAEYVYTETAVRQYDKLLEELEKKGAYYVPVVDGDGNLRWEKSLEQMPDVPGSNVKGPKGDKGEKGEKGDPGEGNIDDTAVGGAAWSSKQIVDKLCPIFEKSGYVVNCEPFKGYPLEVISEIPKENFVSSITLYQEGEEETMEYTVDFGDSFGDGYYNWTTGELHTAEEGRMQLNPRVIVGLHGVNKFHSDCGKTTVMGRTNMLDDSKVGEAGWSSKNIVDKLCPSFTESGGVATCEPVEGYPLEVTASAEATQIVRCGKNLFDFKQGVSDISFVNSNNGNTVESFGFAIRLPAGTYTLHAEKGFHQDGDYIYGYVIRTNGESVRCMLTQGANGNYVQTVTLEQGDIIYIYDGYKRTIKDANDLFARNMVQIEAGSVATTYEPYCAETFAVGAKIPALAGINSLYADAGKITVTGKTDPVIGKQYKLIEDFTLEEAVAKITRKADLNNVPYNFSALRIAITAPVAEANANVIFRALTPKTDYALSYLSIISALSTSSPRGVAYELQNNKGLVDQYGFACSTGGNGDRQTKFDFFYKEWKDNIGYIELSVTTGNFPVGTNIKIYGVRG